MSYAWWLVVGSPKGSESEVEVTVWVSGRAQQVVKPGPGRPGQVKSGQGGAEG